MPSVFIGRAVGVALLLAPVLAQQAWAQDSFQQRLSSDRLGQIDCGSYLAADKIGFTLDTSGANYLLRFEGSPEVFVLSPDNASMGGRVLRYDSGETALQVSGWGGVTVYTDSDPAGLPAVRTGDSTIPELMSASVAEVENAAEDDRVYLARTRHLDMSFTADWSVLAQNASARPAALDAMENVARALDRYGRTSQGHDGLARRVATVTFAIAGRPTVTLSGKTLTVTFDPGQGYQGRASSRAITRALASLLRASQKQS